MLFKHNRVLVFIELKVREISKVLLIVLYACFTCAFFSIVPWKIGEWFVINEYAILSYPSIQNPFDDAMYIYHWMNGASVITIMVLVSLLCVGLYQLYKVTNKWLKSNWNQAGEIVKQNS